MFGNVLKRAAFAALLVFVVASIGCTTRHPPYADAVDRSIVRGGTSWQRDDVCDALGYLEEPVRRAVRSIRITSNCPNYKPRDKDGRVQEAGHCEPTRDICMRPAYVGDASIWHECGHALMMSRSSDERIQMARISMHAYGHTEGDFPRDGILSSYGAVSPWEDFAEWLRWAMCYLYGTPTGQTLVDERVVDASDRRYLQHLQVLRDWGAISQAQYDRLEPLFTVRLGGVPMK